MFDTCTGVPRAPLHNKVQYYAVYVPTPLPEGRLDASDSDDSLDDYHYLDADRMW